MRVKLSTLPSLVALAACAWTVPAGAQIAPLTFELRGGVSAPVGDFRTAEGGWAGGVGEGASFGMDFAYTFRWFLAGYGGFSEHRFACSATGCGREGDLTATGFDGGIRWILGSGRVIPLLRTGLIAYRMEGTAADGDGDPTPVTSRWTVGWEGGAVVSIRVSPRIVLAPGVRYLRMDPRFTGVGELPVETVVADVGLLLGF